MISVLLMSLLGLGLSKPVDSNEKIAEIFKQYQAKGSLIIESLEGSAQYQYNVLDQAAFVPASTFKIPNTLILLEENLITEHDKIKWDGVEREYGILE